GTRKQHKGCFGRHLLIPARFQTTKITPELLASLLQASELYQPVSKAESGLCFTHLKKLFILLFIKESRVVIPPTFYCL
ncbi:unnamed protein product, partial [Larinioides sclopetarius]